VRNLVTLVQEELLEEELGLGIKALVRPLDLSGEQVVVVLLSGMAASEEDTRELQL
jgi:hypothetical protein